MKVNETNYINDSQTSIPRSELNYMHVCIKFECKSCGHKGWDTEFDKVVIIEYKSNCSVIIHHFICPECGSIDNYKEIE